MTATLAPIRVYRPVQLDGPATINQIRLTDRVSYSSPLPDGTYFVIVREGGRTNPRTLILNAAQLAALDRRYAA